MQDFIKIIYSNEEIIRQRKAKWPLVLMIFIISVLLIASPFVTAKLMETPETLIARFEGVESGIMKVIKDYDCSIKNKVLECPNGYDTFKDGQYQFFVGVKENQDLNLPSHYVLLSDDIITFYNPDGYVQGDYSLLDNSSLSDLLEIQKEENISDRELVSHFLQNINQSTTAVHIPQTYASIFVQYIIYVVLVSLINTAINANRLEDKISFKEFLTMNVLAMFSLALLSAIVGLVTPLHATALFPLLYMIRVIMIYFKLLRR